MVQSENSLSYLNAQQLRLAQVTAFKELSEQLQSPFGKFFAYLGFSNINLSVASEYQEDADEFELDDDRNARAREKEMVGGEFVLREEFALPLAEMNDAATELLKDDTITRDEQAYLYMFLALIGQFKVGELYPDDVMTMFTSVRN